MRGIHFLIFLVTLPAIVALGHDVYLYYENQDRGFMFSALGWIWTQYHPESYEWTVEQTAPDTWRYINNILALKATVVTIGFAVVVYALILLLSLLFGEKQSGSKFDKSLKRGIKPGKMQYKRK